jgi:hypothetical protein
MVLLTLGNAQHKLFLDKTFTLVFMIDPVHVLILSVIVAMSGAQS